MYYIYILYHIYYIIYISYYIIYISYYIIYIYHIILYICCIYVYLNQTCPPIESVNNWVDDDDHTRTNVTYKYDTVFYMMSSWALGFKTRHVLMQTNQYDYTKEVLIAEVLWALPQLAFALQMIFPFWDCHCKKTPTCLGQIRIEVRVWITLNLFNMFNIIELYVYIYIYIYSVNIFAGQIMVDHGKSIYIHLLIDAISTEGN